MTPRKETEPTNEQVEAAQKIASVVVETVKSFGHLGFAMGKETDDAIAAFLARRDVARDAEWKEATLDHRRVLVVWRETGMPSYTDLAMEIERLDALLASPSPASSEPPHDPDCTHPVGGCVRKPWKRKP